MQLAPKSSLLTRAADYLARSPQVFLLGLLTACAVEVAVDWNTTLYEINVARRALRQKGENYADVLRKAAQGPMASRDGAALSALAERLFDDPDVVYVRWSGGGGETLRDTLRPDFEAQRMRQRLPPFRDYYRSVMERDTRGMRTDPDGLRARMMRSRHRDLFQIFTDAQERLLARVVPPDADAARDGPPRVLYQDRLADPSRTSLDRSLTYALGTVVGCGAGEGGAPCGVVLVAFRTDRLGREITLRLLKGLGVATFFVVLILAQNIIGRRDKLRLRRLTEEIAAARAAIRAAGPRPSPPPGSELGLSFQQAESIEGAAYDLRPLPGGGLELLLVVPQGGGLASAFASVAVCELYRRGAAALPADDAPAARLAGLCADYAGSPHARPLWLLLLQLRPGGAVRGASSGLPPPAILPSSGLGPPRALPLGEPLVAAGGPAASCPAPRPFAGAAAGAAVALFCDGRPAGDDGPLPQAEALRLLAAGLAEGRAAQAVTDEIAALAGRRGRRRPEDVLVLALRYPSDNSDAGAQGGAGA